MQASYIIVERNGYFWIGQRKAPHPTRATILLDGTRGDPDWVVTSSINLGSKVLAAYSGGKIDLFGLPVQRRWSKLAATASANTVTLVVDGGQLGWSVGQQVMVTSSSWNPWQAELRTITSVDASSSSTILTLDSKLRSDHWSKVRMGHQDSSKISYIRMLAYNNQQRTFK